MLCYFVQCTCPVMLMLHFCTNLWQTIQMICECFGFPLFAIFASRLSIHPSSSLHTLLIPAHLMTSWISQMLRRSLSHRVLLVIHLKVLISVVPSRRLMMIALSALVSMALVITDVTQVAPKTRVHLFLHILYRQVPSFA